MDEMSKTKGADATFGCPEVAIDAAVNPADYS
jgi:hypothetical protein